MKKVVVYVPIENADGMRQAIGDAGGGRIGNYTHCCFSSRGTGRFTPGENATPAIGEIGTPQAVEEERIEFVCEDGALARVLATIRRVHPYEEPAIDFWDINTI